MKLRGWGIAAALLVAFGSAAAGETKVWATSSETENNQMDSAGAEEAEEMPDAAMDEEGTGELSQRWSEGQIRIDGAVFQFPMMFEEWEKHGWMSKDDTDLDLEPHQYGLFRYGKDNCACSVYILNLGLNNEPVKDCIVAGIRIDSVDWDPAESEVELPGGLKLGQATGEDILACYGTPSDIYEGELYTQYTYEEDYKIGVTLYVYRESGLLEDVDVENFVEPEGYDAGEISENVPDSVIAYEQPEALSEELSSYEIELDGSSYSLPVPVSVLLSDGWEIIASETDGAVAANSAGWVGLIKGGQKFRTLALNEEDYATVPQNCWIEELDVGGYELELDGALPGGIRIGTAEEEFLSALAEGGMEYEQEESGDFRYYTYNENSYNQYCQVTVYFGEGGYFPKDTVVEVACSNAFE